LPGLMADHNNGRRGGFVVFRCKYPPDKRPYAERREVVSGYILRTQRSRGNVGPLTPHTEALAASLEGSHLFKFRGFGFQPLVKRKGKHSPPILRTAFHAAIIAVADSI